MAAHITRLTRVKTNPLGNGMWNGNYRQSKVRGRAAGLGDKREEKQERARGEREMIEREKKGSEAARAFQRPPPRLR